MPHVILQHCCNDASCVAVCPVDCIGPAPDRRDPAVAPMLYIDPATCIDCGACIEVCPVDAIMTDYAAQQEHADFVDLNALVFEGAYHRVAGLDLPTETEGHTHGSGRERDPDDEPLRVAIVGSGPSGAYAARELLLGSGLPTRVDMFDRSVAPWGLVRFGVAPDHPATKRVTARFEELCGLDDFALHLNVTIGDHVTTTALAASYHAVVYATGAISPRRPVLPGSDVHGSYSAYDFIRWYNGDPSAADLRFDLTGRTAVIVGNGNAALDVARMLLHGSDELATTDTADHALVDLAACDVEHVVIIGRRGPRNAAFTLAELMGLASSPFDVRVEGCSPQQFAVDDSLDVETAEKLRLLTDLATRPVRSDRRITLVFGASPLAVHGGTRVEGLEVAVTEQDRAGDGGAHGEETTVQRLVPCDLVFFATGTVGQPVAGLPFDPVSSTIPNVGGRVTGPDGCIERGTYVTGWIKRGPSGVIGTNRSCARETVSAVVSDYRGGLLQVEQPNLVGQLLADLPGRIDRRQWSAIDTYERARGALTGRPRVKVTSVDAARAIAGAFASPTSIPREPTVGGVRDVP